jgi:hypothetical protein
VPSERVIRQRRLAAGGAAALLAVVVLVAGTCAFSGGDDGPDATREAAQREPLPQLPRGGRTLLPDKRVVAYYGSPQDEELGALGIGTPDAAADKLERQAEKYRGADRRAVVPALELITVIANADPGDDGTYRSRQEDKVIRRYLRAARRHDMLLILDIQPGRSDFFTETTRLEKWLRQPDVGLALDPEWRVQEGEVPGQVIGSVDAREVNATSAWLAMLTARNKLPQKLFIVHQFTEGMVDDRQLKQRKELAMVLNADGFGTRAAKRSKYRAFTRAAKDFQQGFKLFYKEDEGLMSAQSVLRLKPPPDVVVYE